MTECKSGIFNQYITAIPLALKKMHPLLTCSRSTADAVASMGVLEGEDGRLRKSALSLNGVEELANGLVEEDDGTLVQTQVERQKVHLHLPFLAGVQVDA